MSLPELNHTGYTIEDWKTWDGRWELAQGVAYAMTPAPSAEHQGVRLRLAVAIVNALEEDKPRTGSGEWEVFSGPSP